MEKEKNELEKVTSLLQTLIHHLESMRVAQYVELLEHPARLIFTNFVAGISRGLGIAIGATLVFALMLELLRRLILLHIPGIGDFIADIVRIVESKNGRF